MLVIVAYLKAISHTMSQGELLKEGWEDVKIKDKAIKKFQLNSILIAIQCHTCIGSIKQIKCECQAHLIEVTEGRAKTNMTVM